MKYLYCTVGFGTDVRFDELPRPLSIDTEVYSFQAGAPPVTIETWTGRSTTHPASITHGRAGDRVGLRFDAVHEFFVDTDQRTISTPSHATDELRHLVLDQVLPRVLNHGGHLMIHAGAVDTPRGALVLIGDSGRGKSTLTASFQTAGHHALTDDGIRLDLDSDGQVVCTPTYRGIRLWPDAASALGPLSTGLEGMRETSTTETTPEPGTKLRYVPDAGPTAPTTQRVAALIVLAPPDEGDSAITITPLPAGDGVAALLAQTFRLDPTDTDVTIRNFRHVTAIVDRMPVWQLRYPRDFFRLPAVRAVLLDHLATTA